MKSDRLWNWMARRYDRRVRHDADLSEATERVRRLVAPDHVVLDFACATGVVGFALAGDVREVLGIDTSERMIEIASAHARASGVGNVRFARCSIHDDTLAPASFDVICAFNILHLLDDAEASVRRIAELLAPEGRLLSMTPCGGDAGALVRALAPLVAKVGLLRRLTLFRRADVRALLESGGLEVLESEVLEGTVPSLYAVAAKR